MNLLSADNFYYQYLEYINFLKARCLGFIGAKSENFWYLVFK